MNFDFRNWVNSRLGTPAPEDVPVTGATQPIHIHMPAERKRKVPVPLVVGGILVVVVGLVWGGHHSEKSTDPSRQTSPPNPTPAASVKGLNRSPFGEPSPSDVIAKMNADYNAKLEAATQQDQLLAKQRADQMYPGMAATSGSAASSAAQLTPLQQAAEDRRKRDEDSLTASSVIAIAEAPLAAQVQPVREQEQPTTQVTAATTVVDKTRKDCIDAVDDGVKKYALCEGTILPAVLDNRLVGEFAGPVKAFIRQDIFARDGQHILIPRGTVALGDASKVDKANQKRMEVAFHRLILPDGRGLVLEKMIGLDQAGETALSGKLNRHLLQTFGTAAVIGGLGALSGIGSGSAYTGGGTDSLRQSVSSQMGQQGQTMLQRDLNRPNEITIPEGKTLQIYISEDIHLPEFTITAAKK